MEYTLFSKFTYWNDFSSKFISNHYILYMTKWKQFGHVMIIEYILGISLTSMVRKEFLVTLDNIGLSCISK